MIEILPNVGHSRITAACYYAAVDYIRLNIMEVSYTYTIETNSSALDTLGDLDGDDAVKFTVALVALSCAAGWDPSQFYPMNCGGINDDGVINSSHTLIILSYDASISVPFPVGEPGCPFSMITGSRVYSLMGGGPT
jgi:hypothetical protein